MRLPLLPSLLACAVLLTSGTFSQSARAWDSFQSQRQNDAAADAALRQRRRQEAQDARSRRELTVTLVSLEEGTRVELRTSKVDKSVQRRLVYCTKWCRVTVPPGYYRVAVVGDGNFVSQDREVRITHDTILYVDPDTVAHRYVGLGLGIAGALGFVTTTLVAKAHDDHESVGYRAAAGGFLVSVVANIVGWTMFFTSLSPEVESVYAKTNTRAPRLQAALAPTPGGAALGFSLTF